MSYNTKPRRRFSRKQREAFIEKHHRICHWCRQPILPGQPWAIEHMVPRELMSPDDDPDGDWNLAPIHDHPAECHKIKSRRDTKLIAKSNRVRRELGPVEDRKKRRKIPTVKRPWPKRAFPSRSKDHENRRRARR